MLLNKNDFESALKQDMEAAAQNQVLVSDPNNKQKGAMFGPTTDL